MQTPSMNVVASTGRARPLFVDSPTPATRHRRSLLHTRRKHLICTQTPAQKSNGVGEVYHKVKPEQKQSLRRSICLHNVLSKTSKREGHARRNCPFLS